MTPLPVAEGLGSAKGARFDQRTHLGTVGSAVQADDADSEFNQGPGSSDERLRLCARDEGDAVLDVSLAHDEFTQPFLRAGGVRSLTQRLPEFFRREGVVLALDGRPGEFRDDGVLGADAGVDRITGGNGRSLSGQIGGSWDIWWGSGCEAAGGEEHAEAVVVPVAVAAGEAAVEFDDAVDALGTTVV